MINKSDEKINFIDSDELLACDTKAGKELFWKELYTIVEDGAAEEQERE